MNLRRFIIIPIVSLFYAIVTGRRQKADSERMKKLDFPTNTRDMGVSTNETVRKSWRHKWLKVKK